MEKLQENLWWLSSQLCVSVVFIGVASHYFQFCSTFFVVLHFCIFYICQNWLGHLNLSTWYLGRWFLCCFLVVWNWIVWCCYQQGLCSSVRTKGTLLVLRGVTKPGLLPCFLVWNRIVWPVSARTVFNRGPLAEGYSDSPSTLGVSWLFVNLATRKLGSWLIPNP